MAQREIESAVQVRWTGINNLAQDIASLRNVIAAGQDISATNINTLSSLLNNSLAHYHTYDDAYQLATFGNNGDRNNYYESKDTNPPALRPGNLGNVTAGTDITASHHNTMKDAATFLRTHYHSINDRTA